MAVKLYFSRADDTLYDSHDTGPWGVKNFYWQQLLTSVPSSNYLQYKWIDPGFENYPLNFFAYNVGDAYDKSFFRDPSSAFWDMIVAEGFSRIPAATWQFQLYAATAGGAWTTGTIYILVEIYKRSAAGELTLLFETYCPTKNPGNDLWPIEWTSEQDAFDFVSDDTIVLKMYCYGTAPNAKQLKVGTGQASNFELLDMSDPSPSPSPSPSPELEWDSAGNLLAPVDAAVHLNTNYSMLYSGTHEPKYALDNNPNTYWRPSSTSNHSLYFKFDDPQIVDAFAFWIHNYNEGFGGDKRWSLMCSMDGFDYRTYESVLFTDSRRAGVPLIVLKFEVPRTAKYWIFNLEGFGDPIEGPDDIPVGPIMEIGGVWFLRDYSLPYDNQYPEPLRFEWGNDLALARSGSGYQERRFRGHVKISDKEYVFVQQAHSDLLLNAFKASKGGVLPVAFKPDYDSLDWILCRFTSDHSLQETWSEVFQPKMEVREVGFKRVPYTTKTLPSLSTTVGHWKFAESLADSSDNGLMLSIVDIPGGAVYDYGVCDHNKTCIVLNEDGLLEVAAVDADALDMGTSNFSLELIFATAPVSETTYLLRKIGDNPSPAPSPEPSPSPVAAGYSVSLTTEGKIDVCLGDGLAEVQGSGYGADLDDRSFHYLAVTVDRTLDLLKVYVDGVQVGASLDISAITGSITNSVEPFQLGGENLLSDPKCLIGLLDEVCVSKQLLTAALIASRHAGFSHDGSWRL
jgi:hypothetical protein